LKLQQGRICIRSTGERFFEKRGLRRVGYDAQSTNRDAVGIPLRKGPWEGRGKGF